MYVQFDINNDNWQIVACQTLIQNIETVKKISYYQN